MVSTKIRFRCLCCQEVVLMSFQALITNLTQACAMHSAGVSEFEDGFVAMVCLRCQENPEEAERLLKKRDK